MNDKSRMQVVQRVTADRERRQAQKFAASRDKVAQSEAKLEELQGYHDGYQQGLTDRMTRGMDVIGLRDYRAFLAKLAQAVQQQTEVVMRVRQESDAQQRMWQGMAQRAKIIDKVIERREADDLRIKDVNDQRDTDERALRAARGTLPGSY